MKGAEKSRGLYRTLLKHSLALLLIVAPSISFFVSEIALGAELTNRSVTVGSSSVNAVTSHRFNFTFSTGGSIGSISFEYCTNTPFFNGPCTAPAGLDVASGVLATQSGMTGFSVDASTTANRLVLTRPAAAAAATATQYLFNNITNPSTPNESVFVRIGVYSSTDATSGAIDNGTVLFSTSEPMSVGGFVPPYLTFCVGVTVAGDCSSTTGSFISFGDIDEFSTAVATSQFAAATNDFLGYSVFAYGATMTSGNEIIPPLAANNTSAIGTSQFGINLRANTNPVGGSNASGGGTGVPAANYNTANSFRYGTGEMLASSPLSTDFNRFTVTYIVNVSASQAPGVYATTINYIATAAF